ncbi:MAG: peptidase [Ignavibacteria bacterium CG_4_8_14_3_um_filter_37_9]|nr:nodulation protein NfeD [Ignavibacteria bacterium]OIO23805.1 MAG: peptidase [Ignavibacteria bacterium CG1_02_37_35]PIP78180.1 MAG: peptidase [Ignavibacteria bacterium CG22_combo_CG10-13_8_21_14_all_37_15]PIS44165.1 MAG: peptidase [Ignavibacteria bacterium CG08_land_8_20_14_0_20_37_9]PIW98134.1 MAG: peptidase [Ignavibacteria bacterium CG_4_8_14_3_um_filter_37_9]
MKKLLYAFCLLFVTLSPFTSAQKVFHAKIEGEIDLGLAPFVRRVISDAEAQGAQAIVFEINTFGGRVDAATQIKDAILESKVLTIAFVKNRAISAGALITLSCKKIAMAPGSSIGATTVVDQTGQKQSEKYQSYMRSEMRSTAEKNGRRTDIAEAMVDERVVIPGVDDSTTLITLTSAEAFKYQISDTTVANLSEVLAAFDIHYAVVIAENENWAESFVRFLNNPIISSLLIMIGLVGLYTEIKTPGWGFAGTISLIALGLFFGSSFILQIASIFQILLFVLGIVLLILEIFVIPGFGIAGIAGIGLVIGSIFFSLFNAEFYFDSNILYTAIIQLGTALFFSVVLMFLLVKYLPKSTTFNRLILSDENTSQKGFSSHPSYENLLNKTGEAFTTLRPAGTSIINGRRYDVVTAGDYIEKGEKIKVIQIDGMRIVVQKV